MHAFVDHSYNRTGFTTGGSASAVGSACVRLCEAAFAILDLHDCAGAGHPRTGLVDHIAVHAVAVPRRELGRDAYRLQAAYVARRIALTISGESTAPIGGGGGGGEAVPPARASGTTPVYLYGAASPVNPGLSDLRSAIGYFRGSSKDGIWEGAASEQHVELPPPDFWVPGPQ